MGVCHLCLRPAATDAAAFLPTLTQGRDGPRPVGFALG